MGTCNGARFLREQLATIANQTALPVELVASDDASEDETLDILRGFASSAPFDVRIVENRERLGFAENFLQAARLARGDLVAWADQDDVWMPRKLQTCAPEFDDPDVALVVHSRLIGVRTNALGHPLIRGGPLAGESRLARRRRVLSSARLPGQFAAPGFASVIHRRVLRLADALEVDLPGAFGDYGHDTWTAFVAAALGKVVFLPDVLALYRQHARNVYGAPKAQSARDRARHSVMHASEFVADLEMQAARGSFRADLLRSIDGSGAARRAQMWSDYAAARHRRLSVYRSRSWRELVSSVAKGDYGRRSCGGFGLASLMRDLYELVS